MSDPRQRQPGPHVPPAADEVSIFIDADGTVTICDLWQELLPVAEALGEVAPACPLPPAAARPAAGPAAGEPGRAQPPDGDCPPDMRQPASRGG